MKQKKIGIWYKNLKIINLIKFKKKISKNYFFQIYIKLVIDILIKKRIKKDNFLIKAFQRRFLPNNVTGKIDEKTFKISHFLANQAKKLA